MDAILHRQMTDISYARPDPLQVAQGRLTKPKPTGPRSPLPRREPWHEAQVWINFADCAVSVQTTLSPSISVNVPCLFEPSTLMTSAARQLIRCGPSGAWK